MLLEGLNARQKVLASTLESKVWSKFPRRLFLYNGYLDYSGGLESADETVISGVIETLTALLKGENVRDDKVLKSTGFHDTHSMSKYKIIWYKKTVVQNKKGTIPTWEALDAEAKKKGLSAPTLGTIADRGIPIPVGTYLCIRWIGHSSTITPVMNDSGKTKEFV